MSSDYELLRQENIARNESFLKSLGLDDLGMRKQKKSPTAPKRKRGGEKSKEAFPVVSSRRSLRIAEIPIPNYDLDAAGVVDDDASDDDKGNGNALPRSRPSKPGVQAPPAPGSSRLVDAQLDRVLGSELGSLMADVPTGKAAIMGLTNKGGNPPKFSKYSGAVEWKNCVFLWVNIGGNSGYRNCFSDNGRYMTWFGGSKMTADSPVTKRILAADTEEGTNDDKVVLFVRLPDEPYCCLGLLAVRRAKLDKHPIEIEWELTASERLGKQEQFRRVLAEAS